MRRARRLLRSVERARVARRRIMGGLVGGEAGTSDLDALYHTIHARLAALQRETRYAKSAAAIDDLARLLARAEQTVGGA